MTIAELCNQVLTYIQSINIGNKSGYYTPTGSLVAGTTLKTYSKGVKHCPTLHRKENYSQTTTVYHNIKTNENIGSVYRTQVTNDRIKNDWISFKDTYISKMLNVNDTISISSMFVLIYLIRCFIDTRFMLFTDVYHKNYIWLYNTSTSVNYNVDTTIIPTNFNDFSGLTNLNNIISIFSNEVASRQHIHILKASVT